MRSAIIFLALAAPSLALASPDYTTPMRNLPATQSATNQPRVAVSFFNPTVYECDLHIGNTTYKTPAWQAVRLNVVVGSKVRVDSPTNSKVAKTLQVSAADNDRTITIP